MINQTQRLLRGVALSAAMLLLAAPAALADPQGGSFIAPQQATAPQPVLETVSPPAQASKFNAPKPDVCFLPSARDAYWRQFGNAS